MNLENSILELKEIADKYNSLTDDEKLKNIEEYNKIQNNKELYGEMLLNIKASLNQPIKDSESKDIHLLMNKAISINQQLSDDSNSIDNLIEMNNELSSIESNLTEYYDKLKFEIVNL